MSEIKTDVQTSKISYRIEPKPEGGFVATSSDASMPRIEGASREEVQQKIKTAIEQVISAQLPTVFKLGKINLKLNTNINLTTRTAPVSQPPSDSPSHTTPQVALTQSAAPIVPERSTGTALWVIVGLVVLAAFVYLSYLHR